MTIEWNRVTWYSKIVAIIVFVGTFVLAFNLGVYWEKTHIENALTETQTPAGAPVVGAGEHCGGFIKSAPVCKSGYHCQLTINRPDTGGICVKN